jgi:hypothetical protein
LLTVKRVVIGPNKGKKSAALLHDSANIQQVPVIFWRTTLWGTEELPVDNQIEGDRAVDVKTREPERDGLTFRALEIPPDIKDAQRHIDILKQLTKDVKQKHPPTEQDLARHPSMHRTDTLDCFVVVYGKFTWSATLTRPCCSLATRRWSAASTTLGATGRTSHA